MRSRPIIRWQHAEFSQATKPGVAPGIGCAGGVRAPEIVKAILGRRQPAKLRGGFRWAGGNNGAEMLASPYRRDAMPQRSGAAAGVDEKLLVPRLNQRAWPETILARDRSLPGPNRTRVIAAGSFRRLPRPSPNRRVASLRAGHSFPAFRLPARHRAWRKPHEPGSQAASSELALAVEDLKALSERFAGDMSLTGRLIRGLGWLAYVPGLGSPSGAIVSRRRLRAAPRLGRA